METKPTHVELEDLILAYGDAQASYASSNAPYGSPEYLTLRAAFMDASLELQTAMKTAVSQSFVLGHLQHHHEPRDSEQPADENDKMEIDETEANVLYAAVREHIKANNWDVTDESEWQMLVAFKAIEARLGKFLNGEN